MCWVKRLPPDAEHFLDTRTECHAWHVCTTWVAFNPHKVSQGCESFVNMRLKRVVAVARFLARSECNAELPLCVKFLFLPARPPNLGVLQRQSERCVLEAIGLAELD